MCLVQERGVASWSVGCLTWRVTSARRERPQHHRANPTTNSSGTSVGAEAPSTKDIGERIKAHSRGVIRVLEGGGHTNPLRNAFKRTSLVCSMHFSHKIAFSRFLKAQHQKSENIDASAHGRRRPQSPTLRTLGYVVERECDLRGGSALYPQSRPLPDPTARWEASSRSSESVTPGRFASGRVGALVKAFDAYRSDGKPLEELRARVCFFVSSHHHHSPCRAAAVHTCRAEMELTYKATRTGCVYRPLCGVISEPGLLH